MQKRLELSRILESYYYRGKLDRAEKIWKRALAGYKKALEPENPSTLIVVNNNLEVIYDSSGKLDKTEAMWGRALVGYKKALESEHPDTQHALHKRQQAVDYVDEKPRSTSTGRWVLKG